MEVRKQCPQCDHINIFDQDKLLKKAEVYKPVRPSVYHLPRVVVKKCQSCACKFKIKL